MHFWLNSWATAIYSILIILRFHKKQGRENFFDWWPQPLSLFSLHYESDTNNVYGQTRQFVALHPNWDNGPLHPNWEQWATSCQLYKLECHEHKLIHYNFEKVGSSSNIFFLTHLPNVPTVNNKIIHTACNFEAFCIFLKIERWSSEIWALVEYLYMSSVNEQWLCFHLICI